MITALFVAALQINQTTLDVQPIVRGRLNVSAQAVWDPATGQPLLVVAYAYAADGRIRPDDSITAVLELGLRDTNRDRLTSRSVTLTRGATRAVGYFVLTDAQQPGAWQLKADLPRRHRDITRKGRATPLDTTAIALSDVVLGDSTLTTTITLGETPVLLAPHETVPSDRPIDMYLQVRNRGEVRESRLDLRILRMIDRDSLRSEVLAIRTPLLLQPGINAVQRQLDLSHLKGSEYDIVVTVLDESGGVAARRVTTVYLQQPAGG